MASLFHLHWLLVWATLLIPLLSVQIYYNPLFLETETIQHSVFLSTDLGQLQQSIPFKSLAAKIPSPAYEKSGRGRKPFLKVEGGIGLI